MCNNITGIDLVDQNRDMACVETRLRCSWKLLILIYFDLNVGMACANIRLRCSLISLTFSYLIKLGIWHVLKLD